VVTFLQDGTAGGVYVAAMTNPQPITPVLVCEDIQAEHDFLVRAFVFEPGGVTRGGDGDPVHGEVRAGGAAIWLHRVSPEHQLAAPGSLSACGGGLVVDVADVDDHYARAREAGARIDAPLTDQPTDVASTAHGILRGTAGGSAPRSSRHSAEIRYRLSRSASGTCSAHVAGLDQPAGPALVCAETR
jgi:uncharacterized glyoxalase superfamily protein PhnB